MKKNVISTITKSLPIEFSSLVNYSLLVTLCYINLFSLKKTKLNVQELSLQDQQNIEGEIIPAVVAYWSGATLLTKVGVIGGAIAVVAGAAYIGNNNGYESVKN